VPFATQALPEDPGCAEIRYALRGQGADQLLAAGRPIRGDRALLFVRFDQEAELLHLQGEERKILEGGRHLDQGLGGCGKFTPICTVDRNPLRRAQDLIACAPEGRVVRIDNNGVTIRAPFANDAGVVSFSNDTRLHGLPALFEENVLPQMPEPSIRGRRETIRPPCEKVRHTPNAQIALLLGRASSWLDAAESIHCVRVPDFTEFRAHTIAACAQEPASPPCNQSHVETSPKHAHHVSDELCEVHAVKITSA